MGSHSPQCSASPAPCELKMASRGSLTVSAVVLAHAAFSSAHLNNLRRGEGLPVTGVPFDVWVEGIVGFGLALLGALLAAGSYKHISFESEQVNKTFDVLNAREEFQMYNHRGVSLRKRKAALAARRR